MFSIAKAAKCVSRKTCAAQLSNCFASPLLLTRSSIAEGDSSLENKELVEKKPSVEKDNETYMYVVRCRRPPSSFYVIHMKYHFVLFFEVIVNVITIRDILTHTGYVNKIGFDATRPSHKSQ